MLLLLVVVRTRNVVPEDEELDLTMRPLLAMEKDKVAVKVSAKEVIHVIMEVRNA